MPAFFSPSKLNLFFLIIDKRPDGYHQISSLLQAIDLGDTLHIDLAADDEMRCSDARLPTDRRNLVIKARDLFRAKLAEKREKSDFCAHIFLDKKVPMEAGLGGGSSNAATTLWALNHLLKSPFTDDELAQMGSEIGSDIPFFFSSGSALCSGRGEIVRPPGFIVPKEQVTIVKPDFGLSTAAVYGAFDFKEIPDRGRGSYFNDLERAAFRVNPELKKIKGKLLALGFHQVVMTGSGSAFFCLGEADQPQIEGVTFFSAEYLTRKAGNWYNPLD